MKLIEKVIPKKNLFTKIVVLFLIAIPSINLSVEIIKKEKQQLFSGTEFDNEQSEESESEDIDLEKDFIFCENLDCKSLFEKSQNSYIYFFKSKDFLEPSISLLFAPPEGV